MENFLPGDKFAVQKKVHVKGKFLYEGDEKFYMKGVTYGTFAPDENDWQFPVQSIVKSDFELMARNGFNCVRTYTVPPKHVLDLAVLYNLKLMVGIPWEQHITFLDSKKHSQDIMRRVKVSVQACKQHPSILCYSIGNEIPATVVRWYGPEKIQNFLKKLYKVVKRVDPDTLVTYVNYPTTEYLNLEFLDFDCWNVYLETPEKMSKYLARLHNLSGDRPMVLAEIGLDSMRNGEEQQAEVLKWQTEIIFGKGCAGMFVFAWTDEWWRGGAEIMDWDFGIVDRHRQAKHALCAVSNAMNYIPVPRDMQLPFISVLVCTYNGSGTIRKTLDELTVLNYPSYEIVVVNDGSTDNVEEIIKEFPVRLINAVTNGGLSAARNIGMQAARGEIIAYIDDDAYPDPQWLHYIAYAYRTSGHDCIGGPNIAPLEDGLVATCVANAPGGPVHVLETDELAEHVPGCNMTFRREALLNIGGFDPIYTSAGDDVDACWRIQQNGGTIGFHPAAVVWHHRRNSVKAYWKQQKGYGKAEALLEIKWPGKYNGFGHLTWAGRIYGNGCTLPLKLKKNRIFHGTWGSALFQSVYQPYNGLINALPLMPEWYFVVAMLAVLTALGVFWPPLLWTSLLLIASLIVIVTQAVKSAVTNSVLPAAKQNWQHYGLITILHLIQPVARLYGRLRHGLTPWRKRSNKPSGKFLFVFTPKVFTHWSETWRPVEEWLEGIEKELIVTKTRVQRGGNFDRWDLQLRNGIISVNRAVLMIEEHGSGKQFLRLRSQTLPSRTTIYLTTFIVIIAAMAALNSAWIVSAALSLFVVLIFGEYVADNAVLLTRLNNAFTAAAAQVATEIVEQEEAAATPDNLSKDIQREIHGEGKIYVKVASGVKGFKQTKLQEFISPKI